MSRKYKFKDPQGMYFVSFSVVYWIDVFIRSQYREIFLDSVRFCQKDKGLEIYAWCLMPSHVHLLMAAGGETNPEVIIQALKSYTSRELRNAIKENPEESRRDWMLWMMERAGRKNSNNIDFQFWQQHNKPKQIQSHSMAMEKLHYTHNNPVEAGFVEFPEHYLYSSAPAYAGKQGLLDVILL